MRYLLMFHLGPVQPFIAQARKTSDLWMGSYLLSWLMRKSLEEVYKDNSSGLIFPYLGKDGQPREASAGETVTANDPQGKELPASAPADTPNKFVAVHDEAGIAEDKAKAVEAKIREQWQLVVDKAKEQTRLSDADLGDAWERQINSENIFEIAWVVVPYEENQYSKAYSDALEALEGRKLLHDFKPQDERGEKSTISGERQILATSKRWAELAKEQQFRGLRLSEGEQLDAVDVVKRLAQDNSDVIPNGQHDTFPSADTVATRSFVAALLKSLQDMGAGEKPKAADDLINAVAAWSSWLTKHGISQSSYGGLFFKPDTTPGLAKLRGQLTDSHVQSTADQLLSRDGEAFFKESFSPKRLAFRLGKTEQEVRDNSTEIRSLLGKMIRTAGKLGVQSPSPYYAVIMMDGDRMGKIVGSLKSPEAHTAFSQALSKFAHRLQGWVSEEYLGRVVYAGGDDTLILAPADRALKLAQKLQADYVGAATQTLNRFVQEEKKIEPPTASVGIVIAHRLMPLRIVIEEARRAEEAAKHRYGRNALVVTVLWRGGRSVSVGAQWDAKGALGGIVELTNRFVGYFRDETLSDRFAYVLEGEAPALVGLLPKTTDVADATRAKQGMISEMKRLLKRQRKEGNATELSDDPSDGKKTIEQVAEEIVTLAQAIEQAHQGKAISLAKRGPRRGLVEVCGWLRLASFLARGREAGEDE